MALRRQAQEELCWLALLTMHTSRPDVDRLKEDAPMAAAKPHMCAEHYRNEAICRGLIAVGV
jgi:hypothetical protein